MNPWKFFDITHRDHVICNPLSSGKLDEFVELLDLTAGARVLDIACGAEQGSFDLALCMGASWIYGGYRGTLRALGRFVRPGGQVAVGEPYWRTTPSPEYLEAAGFRADEFGTHVDNVAAGVQEGLVALYTLVNSEDDWDRYEALQWRAAERYAAANPDDPDVPELLQKVRHDRDTYLCWGRKTLGWSVYLFRR